MSTVTTQVSKTLDQQTTLDTIREFVADVAAEFGDGANPEVGVRGNEGGVIIYASVTR